MNDEKRHLIRDTSHLDKSLIEDLNLIEEPRDETEKHLTDIVRFGHQCYQSEDVLCYSTEELKYFRDPALRDLYKAIFIDKASNPLEVIETAVAKYTGAKSRILACKKSILTYLATRQQTNR